MNPLDIVFIAIGTVFLLWGLFRGLVKEIISTLGTVGAYVLANAYNDQLAPVFKHLSDNPHVMHMAAYFTIFIAVFLAAMILSVIVIKLLRLVPPAWIEFPGGALMGGAKGAFICCVILVVLTAFMPESPWLKQSTLAPYLKSATELMTKTMPDKMKRFDPESMTDDIERSKQEMQDKMMDGAGAKAQEMADKIKEKIDKQIQEIQKTLQSDK